MPTMSITPRPAAYEIVGTHNLLTVRITSIAAVGHFPTEGGTAIRVVYKGGEADCITCHPSDADRAYNELRKLLGGLAARNRRAFHY